jgi:hypothetical protein
MKKRIQEILEKLQLEEITLEEAQNQLCVLFGVMRSFYKEDMEKAYKAGFWRGQYNAGYGCESDAPLFSDWLNQNYT